MTDYARQGDWDSSNLTWRNDRAGVVREIRAARGRGLRVVLVLRLALDHAFRRNRFLWHGMVQPRSEGDLDLWFSRYTAFAERWAEVAESEGVDVLVLGSELNALTSTVPVVALPALEEYYLNDGKQAGWRAEVLAHRAELGRLRPWLRDRGEGGSLAAYLEARSAAERAWAEEVTHGADLAAPGPAVERVNARRRLLEAHWERLIGRLRLVYHGRLGYAANFDQYREVGFWDRLDVLGVNAYFPLRRRLLRVGQEGALYPELVAGWRRELGRIEDLRRERNLSRMPVLFTELGYTRRADSTLEPWADTGFSLLEDADGRRRMVVWREQPEDLEERALALRALRQAAAELADHPLAGILYWKLSTRPADRAVEPFVAILGGRPEDPLLAELRAFRRPV